MYFQNIPGRTVGLCFSKLNVVVFDVGAYSKFSNIERRALVYHELGHCMCELSHDGAEGTFCPKSLMYPSTSIKLCYDLNWSKYIKDLREKCQK